MKEKKKVSTIPQTDSIAELAQFWDEHDLPDFEDELEEVTEPVFERRSSITVKLGEDEISAIQKIARSKGVSLGNLIQGWVHEKIHV